MSCQSIFAQIEGITEPIVNWTIQSAFYQNFGLLVVFLYSATPSIFFIPNEAFYLPLIQNNGVSPIAIAVLIGIGGSIGDFSIYMLTRHGVKYFTKEERIANKSMDKWLKHFHKHKWWIFIISPSIPALGDLALIYAGIKKIHYTKFLHFLIAGNFIRAGWGIAFIMSGIEIFGAVCK